MASIIRKPGSQYWHACYRDDTGRQRRKSTKETDRKKASRLAELYERIAQRRLKPDRVRQAVAEVMEEAYPSQFPAATVRERVTQWLTLKRPAVEESTFLFYSKGAEKFLAFLKESADLDIGEIEKRHIAAFRDSLLQKVSVTTARHDLKTVKAIFETAKDDGYLDRDPTEGVKVRDRSGESIRRAFTLEELHAILEIADPEWQSLIRFGLYTGQRLGDCSRLTWAHIDTARNLIRFQVRKTKKSENKPIAAPLLTHILALPVPPRPDAPIHPRSFRTRVNRLSNQFVDLLHAAGLRAVRPRKGLGVGGRREATELSFHSLRHYLPFRTMSCNRDPPRIGIGNLRSWRAKPPDIARHSLVPSTGCSERRGVDC